jgi:hypothetical protein
MSREVIPKQPLYRPTASSKFTGEGDDFDIWLAEAQRYLAFFYHLEEQGQCQIMFGLVGGAALVMLSSEFQGKTPIIEIIWFLRQVFVAETCAVTLVLNTIQMPEEMEEISRLDFVWL